MESQQDKEKRESQELKGKNVAHYQLMLSAWIQSRMERDKAIIMLSSWAIGLFITLLVALYDKATLRWSLILAIGSITAFCVAILTSLTIYQKNTRHIEQNLRGEQPDSLEKFDRLSIGAFLVGIILFVSFVSVISMNSKGETMPNKNGNNEVLKESLQGINKMAPNNLNPQVQGEKVTRTGGKDATKSLDGIGNVTPQNLKPAKPAEPQSTPRQPTSTDNSGDKS